MGNKKIYLFLVIVAIVLIGLGIYFDKDNLNVTIGNNNKKEVLSIDEVKVSKKSNYELDTFSQMIGFSDIDYVISQENITLSDISFIFEEDYTPCDGTVIFKNTQDYKNWQFNSNCEGDTGTVDLDFKSLDTGLENLEVVNVTKVKQGYIVLMSENTEDSTAFTASYVLLVNDNLEIIWKSNINDNSNTSIQTLLYDSLEVDDGYYVVGYASNAVDGDFPNVGVPESEFAFLIKYDLNGNKQPIVPLGASHIHNFLGYYNGIVYMNGQESIVSVKGQEVSTLKLEDNILIQGMTDKYYYGYKNEEIKLKDGSTSSVGKIKVLSVDGSIHFEKSIEDIRKCSKANSCSISSMVGNGDYFLTAVDNQVYVMNYNGETITQLDYSKVEISDKEITSLTLDKVLMLDNSYVIISNPTDKHVMVEEFDFAHKLLYRKNYYFDSLNLLNNLTEEFKWNYNDRKLNRINIINNPKNILAIWSFR